MRKGGKQVVDSLAGIEDMLSSLCGAQSAGPVLPPNGFEDGTQEMAEEDIMHTQHLEAGAPIADEQPTTPEKSNSTKERPRRGRSRRQTRSSVSKPLPARNRVRKSRRERPRNTSARRSGAKATAPRDIDDDGVQKDFDLDGAVPRDIDDESRQQDFDLKAAVPRDIEKERRQQDYEFLGTSSDDRENAKLFSQMKRLAEEQLNVYKRKNDAMNVNAVNAMKREADQCSQRMKNIAGNVSSKIINRATVIEEGLPRNLTEQTATEMNSVRRETEAFSDFLRSQEEDLKGQVDMLLQQLKEQRQENKEQHDAKEREMYANSKAACESGQRLTSVLQEIEKMLDIEQFKGKSNL